MVAHELNKTSTTRSKDYRTKVIGYWFDYLQTIFDLYENLEETIIQQRKENCQ